MWVSAPASFAPSGVALMSMVTTADCVAAVGRPRLGGTRDGGSRGGCQGSEEEDEDFLETVLPERAWHAQDEAEEAEAASGRPSAGERSSQFVVGVTVTRRRSSWSHVVVLSL